MKPKRNYDTIILDLGGVLIDVDYGASAHAFRGLGFTEFDALYSKAQQDHLFDGFETGTLSPAQFRDRVRHVAPIDLADAQIDMCWNAMLGHIPAKRLVLVERLREHYNMLLLSNTNMIHVPAFEAILEKENGISDLKRLFDGAYYSCELGMRKPNTDIFQYVLAQHDAQADRTLFIDDSIQHVEGARQAGLYAEHLDLGKEDVVGMVDRLGLLP